MGVGLIVDAEEVAEEIRRAASESITEEDLRQRVEYILRRKVIEKLQEMEKTEVSHTAWKPPRARYEATLISGGRVDALHGHVIIEYEKPQTFKTRSGFEKAVEQVKKYIIAHAKGKKECFPKYFGVALDGYKIGFVRYRLAAKNFESKGPYDVNASTVAKLVEAIIGLRRRALTPEELLRDFGPNSLIARSVIKTLYAKLLNPSEKTKIFFEDWKRVFSQVCSYSPDKVKGLEKHYGLTKADPEKLLFAVHTYYALIMKLLAAEIASLYVTPKIWSYLRALEDAYYRGHVKLREELRELEEGGIFQKLGILNFLEADYFGWYLDEWDQEVGKAVMSVVDRLVEYDPSTADLEPERIRDLFKRLYQNLVPKKIRHDLGEYYTPDWLAELVLNEVGWTQKNFEKVAEEKENVLAPLDLRLLDPACGSGTFLILAIGRLKSYVEEHWIDKKTALRKITRNIVGFDLNPLAVIASRANYLISLGDMLREKGDQPIEIPVYLADSILVERRQTLTAATYVLRTVAGEFSIPETVVKKGLLPKVLVVIEECVRGGYNMDEFKARLLREVELKEADEVSVIVELFNNMLRLEREGKNRIWTRILKNSFAPFFIGKFNYVVGNPPWINWENLPESYRECTKPLWDWYGLTKTTKGMGLGKVKRDMAMLFVARCLDRFTKEDGKLAFLIPFTVYKTRAGAGFRQFLSKGYWKDEEANSPCKVLKIHDLEELLPFEGAMNRTSLIVVRKSGETKFPIRCIYWKSERKSIAQELELEEVQKITKRFDFILLPLERNKPETMWIEMTEKAFEGIKKVFGITSYRAYAGVYTALNQVYWIKVVQEESNGLLITNPSISGQKKTVRQVRQIVEKDLVYPLIRGRDVEKWYTKWELGHILLPVDKHGRTLPHDKLKVQYPQAWKYFSNFIEDLVNRGGEPYKSKFKPYRENRFEVAEKTAPPFYWLFNVKPSLNPYKVVWKEVSARQQKLGFEVAVIEPKETKPVIPDHTVVMIPCRNLEEAHYLAAILNSNIISLACLYMITSGLKNLKISKFNPQNPLHQKLSLLSQKAHKIARKIYEENRENLKEELGRIEAEIDETVAELYDITKDELKEIKRCLAILKGERMKKKKSSRGR